MPMAKKSLDVKKVSSSRNVKGSYNLSNGKKTSKSATTSKEESHPLFWQEWSAGQKAADIIAKFGGSWTFIIIFFLILLSWMYLNSVFLVRKPFDPYPYILLNLVLSCLAAIQAPIILMAQNRQAERDRVDAKYDHQVNRKAEREIQEVHRKLEKIEKLMMIKRRK